MAKTINFTEESPFAVEGSFNNPLRIIEGSTITFSCNYWGTASTPSTTAYRKRQVVTTTVFPTNTPTASGSVVTLSPATGFVGGARYVINVIATVASNIWVKKIEIVCGRDEDE